MSALHDHICTEGACQAIGGEKGHIVECVSGWLLLLFSTYRWKPIPHCTGRYTCREHRLSKLTPYDLLEECNRIHQLDSTAHSASVEHSAHHNTTSVENVSTSESTAPDCRQQWEFRGGNGKDEIIVTSMDSSASVGLITYVKKRADALALHLGAPGIRTAESAANVTHATYIHTLNSRSGFRRKLDALGYVFIGGTISGISLVPKDETTGDIPSS